MKFTCFLLCWSTLVAFAQKTSIPALHTSSDSLVMYLDGQKDEFNGINKLGSTFDYSFVVAQDSSVFKLVSKADSIQLVLRPGKNTVFQIVRMQQRDTVTCNFTIQKRVKPAAFNEKYKAANSGKTRIEIPEVYELVNVIFTLTEYGKTDAIYKNADCIY